MTIRSRTAALLRTVADRVDDPLYVDILGEFDFDGGHGRVVPGCDGNPRAIVTFDNGNALIGSWPGYIAHELGGITWRPS